MFKKKATYKPASAIKGKLRKQLVAHLTATCPQCFTETEDALKLKLATLLPTTLEACTILTSKGEKATLYIQAKQPRYLELESDGGLLLVPLLYTLQHAPDLLPIVRVPQQVLSFLQSGADLMLRGVIVFPEVEAGSPVAIGYKDEGNIVIVGVGLAAINKATYDADAGGSGKAVLMVSSINDTLHPKMSISDTGASIGEHAVPMLEVSRDEAEPLGTWQEVSKALVEDDDTHAKEPDSQEPVLRLLTTAETDDAFLKALLYGLYQISEGAATLDLPISASTYMERYILPYLPFDEERELPQIKQSSWKKTSKFLAKQKDLLKCKEQQGQTVVTEIYQDAQKLHEFVPYRIWQADEEEVGVKATQPKKHIMVVHRLYTLPAKLRPIIGNEPAVSLTENQVKERLERYYGQESLRFTKGSVTLDLNIANLLLPADFAHSTVSTKSLLNTCLGLASQSYKIGNDALVRKGSPPKVVTKVKGQGPNGRLVTIITKLEAYFSKAEIEDIAETLRKRCAGATVVRPGLLPGSIELQIQGAWSKHIQSVLEDHGMAPAWMTIEKTRK